MDLLNGLSACNAVSALFWLLAQGPVVAFLVNRLKRIEFVRKNPLAVVGLLNVAITLSTGFAICDQNVARLLEQLLAGFTGAIASYEVTKRVFSTPKPPAPTKDEVNWDR